jgi:hypothetical protein
MGQFGVAVARAPGQNLPVLSGRRMGEVFTEIAAELKKIREQIELISGGPAR